jgi:GT2 family glycosyltransferase
MCLAFTTARSFGSFDAYLLFNDDLLVTELGVMGAFEDFRHCNLRKPTILAASTTSGDGREITYTGYRSASKIRPRAFTEVIPNGTLTSIDVFNGNFVLVPGPFFERVNGLDPGFLHTLGDIDLGITAKAGGLDIMLARLPVGSCEKNIQFDSGFRAASFLKRLAMLNHPRFRSHDFLYFVRKHRPTVLLPLFFLTFHFKRLLKLLVG